MMMRVKNHHTPPTMRPDNDLGEQKEGGWKKEEERRGGSLEGLGGRGNAEDGQD